MKFVAQNQVLRTVFYNYMDYFIKNPVQHKELSLELNKQLRLVLEPMKKDPFTTSYNLGHKDRTHFDWPNVEAVIVKVQEELDEFSSSLNEGRLSQIHELGDLLFTIIQAARHLEIDPTLALHTANDRYTNRFNLMKELVAKAGFKFEDLSVNELETYWTLAKKSLKSDEVNALKNKFNL